MTDAELIALEIDRMGEEITVRRVRATATAARVRAVIRDASAQSLATGDEQITRRAIVAHARLSAAGFPVPPKEDDQIISGDGTFAIRAVNTIRLAGTPSHYVMSIIGGA